jgi:hypothetical protein
MLLEAHFAGPFDIQLLLDDLLAQTFSRREGHALIGKEEALSPVPLFEPFQFLDSPSRFLLSEVLVIQREGTERTVLVVAPSRKLHGQHRFRRQIQSEREAVIVGSRQLVDIFRIKRLVDRNFPVLAINQVRDFAEIFFPGHLIDELEQRGFALEHDDVVSQIEQPRTAPHVIDQSGEDAAADGQMDVGSGFLDQTTECQTGDNLRSRRNRYADQVRLVADNGLNEVLTKEPDVGVLAFIPNDLHQIFG